MWPGFIAYQLKVLVVEVKDVLCIWINLHNWKLLGLSCHLQFCLLKMVQIQMGVTSCMNELTRLISSNLGNHLEKQGVTGNIERHSKERIGRTLVELE